MDETNEERRGVVTVGLYYEVKPEGVEAFLAKFEEVRKVLDGADGHRASHLYRRVDDPCSFAILGEWDSRERFLEFVRSDLFKQVTRWGLAEVLREKPRHKVYTTSEPLAR